MRTKILNWATRHKGPTADEIKLEIRRLEGLVLSYEALKGVRTTSAFLPTQALSMSRQLRQMHQLPRSHPQIQPTRT